MASRNMVLSVEYVRDVPARRLLPVEGGYALVPVEEPGYVIRLVDRVCFVPELELAAARFAEAALRAQAAEAGWKDRDVPGCNPVEDNGR